MKWYCTVCGYVYEGPEAPEACPVCKAPKENLSRWTRRRLSQQFTRLALLRA